MDVLVRCALVIGFVLFVHAPATYAGLMFDGGNGNGEVRVTQTVLSQEWVNIFIEVKFDVAYTTFAGGFETQGGAVFRQGAGVNPITPENEYDTSFLNSDQATGTLFIVEPEDSSSRLHVEGMSRLGADANFGPAGEWLPFAQLVMAPGTSALAFFEDNYERRGFIEFLDANNDTVGTLSGSITAVPEPSSLAALGLFAGLYCASRWRRRRQLK